MLELYIESLKNLQEAKISFAVTGTFALYLQKKKFAECYTIKDCDIFISYHEETLRRFVIAMRQAGWTVKIWEEEADLSTLMQQAKDKYYIRCTNNELIFDATYEHEANIYGDPEKDIIQVNGMPVINAAKILEGKKYRNTERDRRAVECFGNV